MVIRAFILMFAVLLMAGPVRAADNDPQAFAALHQFYADRDYRPVWTGNDRFNRAAKAVPDILDRASAHGLAPEAYNTERMRMTLDNEPEDQSGWYQAEILWSYGVWRYASDLLGAPIDAATLESVVDDDIAANLEELAPDSPLYKALQGRLSWLDAEEQRSAEAARSGKMVPIPELIAFRKSPFRPGSSAPAVPLLRARMAEYGAAPLPEGTPPEIANVYDESLARAVERFQTDYGLKNDGAIGTITLGILNRSPAEERQHVLANLQRLREPHRRVREDKRVEVSIARFMLTAFEGNEPVLTMPVVVGQPKRQTISFRTEISGVRLNPTWTVPTTIRKEDFIPLLTTDPGKLVKKHGLRFTKGGKSFDPTQIDWTQVSPQEIAQVGMWAPAGAGNPLGAYRVIMENPYDIYLHDTNHKELFKGTMRALSSGCVRVEKPELLAQFILKGQAGWNPQKIKETVAEGQTRDVIIENKIPIYLDYMTAWINDRANLVLGHDVYALDKSRYATLVNNVLTTQRNAQHLLMQAAMILQPELKEARQDIVPDTTSN